MAMRLEALRLLFLRGVSKFFLKNHCNITIVLNFYTYFDIKIDFASSLQHFFFKNFKNKKI